MDHTFFDLVNSKCISAKRNEWISVKDRLPEINEPVLVHCRGYISIAWRVSGDNGGWYWNSQMSYPEEMVDTDYWMPLPNPPEESANDNI